MHLRRTGAAASVARGAVLLAIAALLGAIGCGDKKAKYPTCGSDKDCKKGEHCVSKQCRQCAKDGHCDAGEICRDGGCVLASGACRDDGDCTGGRVCLGNKCIACSQDSQCGPDRRCSGGRCLARGACARDEDCADDEDCLKGTCSRGGRDRPPDASCELRPIYFGFDRTTVDKDARAVLNQNAECVQSVPGHGVFLSGFTDPRGTEEYNIALSEQRAEVVADYLARLGIDPARFRVIPKGETAATGNDDAGWALDRRVETEWQ